MATILKFKCSDKVVFDDYTNNGDGTMWSQICQECYENKITHQIPHSMDMNIGGGICGVKGCNNESLHYIDLDEEDMEQVEE